MHVLAFFHVENVARDQQAVEVEFQEQQLEFVESDQVEEKDLEANFANTDS